MPYNFYFWELQAFASPLLISQQQGLMHMNYIYYFGKLFICCLCLASRLRLSTWMVQSKRDFMNIVLGKPETSIFTISNIYDPCSPEISIIMDFSHTMKTIRNKIYKSGKNNYDKRNVVLNGKYIHWEHWWKAYFGTFPVILSPYTEN